MKDIPLIEYVGYTASIFIAASMFMKDIKKLRFINLMGSLIFTIYGMCIKAYPVVLTNTVIVITNIYYLFKLYREK